MKKTILTLGTAVTAIAPVATVVACGDKVKAEDKAIASAKTALNSLASKEVLIADTSGTIDSKKTEILAALKLLTGFAALDLKNVVLNIKDGQTSNLGITRAALKVTLSLKGGKTIDFVGFTVKRSKTDAEAIASVTGKLKALPNMVQIGTAGIINGSSTVAAQKAAILSALKLHTTWYGGTFPSGAALEGVAVVVKENDSIVPAYSSSNGAGVAFDLTLTKNSTTVNITSYFKVRKTPTSSETKAQGKITKVLNAIKGTTDPLVAAMATQALPLAIARAGASDDNYKTSELLAKIKLALKAHDNFNSALDTIHDALTITVTKIDGTTTNIDSSSADSIAADINGGVLTTSPRAVELTLAISNAISKKVTIYIKKT